MEDNKKTLYTAVDAVGTARSGLKITGLSGSSARYLAALAAGRLDRSILFVTTEKRFDTVVEDIDFYIRDVPTGHTLITFPSWGFAPYERLIPQPDTAVTRIKTLRAIANGGGPFVLVSSAGALMTRVISALSLSNMRFVIETGKEHARESIIRFLLQTGYTQASIVVTPGSFSVRGGILDFYSPDRASPVRVEFYGDLIESIREFDPMTQRSIGDLMSCEIIPVSELVLNDDAVKKGIRWFRQRGAEVGTPIKRIRETAQQLEAYQAPAGFIWASGALYGGLETIFDYLPKGCLVFVDEPEQVLYDAQEFYARADVNFNRTIEKKEPALPPESLFLTPDELDGFLLENRAVELNPTRISPTDAHIVALTADHEELRARIDKDRGSQTILTPLVKKIAQAQQQESRLALVCLTSSQGQRMKGLLAAHGMNLEFSETLSFAGLAAGPGTFIIVGALKEGFEDPAQGLVVITEEEIFGSKIKVKRLRRQDLGEAIESPDTLTPGDFVVHTRFGIGKYIGLANLNVMGITGDFIHLEYDDSDKLYIPIDKIALIHRYRGADGHPPALNKLGSAAWEKSKSKVREEIIAVAKELARLYAARQALPGHRFENPGSEFSEFEALFPFEETPDQLSAVNDIIADMTGPTPMDRLVAGDVGYGKTEVAIRAAFLAAMDHKQVALVVPTTILAEQHYTTFSERFRNWPVRVCMLSRFLEKKEQKEVIDGMAAGTVDIVIGTHRLLSKDIRFSDLGLLIIDEEHRFGVAHKEKIVKMKTQVDVLTMTATPIPRTLSMSVMGIRDISIINTPPANRLSVKTYVSEFEPEVIKEAITREIGRGGQVFFVNNRIKNLPAMMKYLSRLVPEVRIGVAHGQMEEHELERVMLDFVDRKIDLLLSTAIIESGLDIPSANTIIINRADTFGLAQLYQIRGRVGRSTVRAYAYFLVPGSYTMTADAKKRLKVISQFTELGSGLKIAEYDLEIRGAGNLLGSSQSGHINAVGYEMYKEMVDEALREIKGEATPLEIDPEISLPISAYIPSSYIPDSDVRLGLYRRLISSRSAPYLTEIAAEINDRFGPPPEEAANLIALMQIKDLARQARVIGMKYRKGIVAMTFWEKAVVDAGGIVSLIQEDPQSFGVNPDGTFKYRPVRGSTEVLLDGLKNVLQRLSRYVTF